MSKALENKARKLVNDLVGTNELADYVQTLEPGQKQRIAGFVIKHGYHASMQALYVNPAELEQLMIDTNHLLCEVCDEWFIASDVANGMCIGEGSCTEEMA